MTDWIDLGGLEFRVVSGGRFRLDGGGMFGIIPRVLWERHDPPDERNRVSLEANCVVVRSAGQLAVIDTGNGSKLSEKERDIFALEPDVTVRSSLETIGIAASDINWVILSHLHLDHVGGASEWGLGGEPVPSFPEARCVVQKGEWEDAVANRSTMRVSYRPENLKPLEGCLDLLEGDAEVFPGVRVEVAPGHTPHYQMVHLEGTNGHAVFAGDVLPTFSHLRSTYNMAYDLSPYENMLRKQQLLENAARENWLIIPSHDLRTPVGQVEASAPGQWRLRTVTV